MNEADNPVVVLSPCVRLFVGWLREEGLQLQCERMGGAVFLKERQDFEDEVRTLEIAQTRFKSSNGSAMS